MNAICIEMTLYRQQTPGPPNGFRKAIPVAAKIDVVIRQLGTCSACGEWLGTSSNCQFDHVPAIQLRVWDEAAKDTVPASNDPNYIFAKHKDCHSKKTTGRQGESKLNAINGDAQIIAKVKRVSKKEAEFRQRILAKQTGSELPPQRRKKHQWPKQKLQSRGFVKSKSSQKRQRV